MNDLACNLFIELQIDSISSFFLTITTRYEDDNNDDDGNEGSPYMVEYKMSSVSMLCLQR